MKKHIALLACLALLACGILFSLCTHDGAVAEGATAMDKAFFSLSVITAVAGLAGVIAVHTPRRRHSDIRSLAMASVFAALCYVGCTYLRIPIPGFTSFFHFGNTFCVLAALFLGGFWGGMAGSVGMTLSDLLNGYVDSAPRTFILKLCIGLVAGLVAHRCFHLSEGASRRRVPLSVATALSCAAGMGFNMVADPLLGYFYKMYVMGIPQDLASSLAKISSLATAVNAAVAVFSATVFYLALRPALSHAGLMPRLDG